MPESHGGLPDWRRLVEPASADPAAESGSFAGTVSGVAAIVRGVSIGDTLWHVEGPNLPAGGLAVGEFPGDVTRLCTPCIAVLGTSD